MRTAVVTGAAGFVGSHVCDVLLAAGFEVLGVDSLATGRGENLVSARRHRSRFAFAHVDVREPAFGDLLVRREPEVVCHLAAQSSVAVSVADPVGDASANVVGSVAVLEASVRAGARKVVYAGSGGTLYGNPRRFPTPEEAGRGARPRSPYGISKAMVAPYLRFYRDQHGLDFTMLALANVYGPRQDPAGEAGVVAAFGRAMLAGGQPVVFGDGEQTRDYVYVADVARAFLAALDAGSGLVLNIGTGVERSVLEVFRRMASLAGYRGEPAFGPPRPGDLRRSALDVGLARRVLGWTPLTSFDDGLTRTLAWLGAEGRPQGGRRGAVPAPGSAG